MSTSDDTRKAPRKVGEDTPSEESLLVDGAVEFFEALLRYESKSGMLPGTWILLDAAGIGQPPPKELELLREMGMVQYLKHSRGVHARIPVDSQWPEFGNKGHRFAMRNFAPEFLGRQKNAHAITEESTDNAEQSHKPEEHQSGKASHVVKENHIVQASHDDEAPQSVKSTHNLGAPQQEQAGHHPQENQPAQSNQKPIEHQHNQWAKDAAENQNTEATHQRSEDQTNRGRHLAREIQSAQSGHVVQESQVTVAGQHSQEIHGAEASHPDKEIQKNKTSNIGDWKRCADELADALEEVCSHIPEAEDHAQFSALQRSVFPALKALNRLRKLKGQQ